MNAPERIEALAEKVHEVYLDTCKRLGWDVSPANRVSYSELSEDSKELDRATVRAVLDETEPAECVWRVVDSPPGVWYLKTDCGNTTWHQNIPEHGTDGKWQYCPYCRGRIRVEENE